MFNLGLPEILMIGGIGLLVFGPKRLPELGKSLGKGIRDFKKALEGGDAPTSTVIDSKNVAQSEKKEATLPPGEPSHT